MQRFARFRTALLFVTISAVMAAVADVMPAAELVTLSPANYEELGGLYKDQGQFEKAREAFNHAITGRGDSVYTFYSRAHCSLGLNDLAGAIPDLADGVPGRVCNTMMRPGRMETTEPKPFWVDVSSFLS